MIRFVMAWGFQNVATIISLLLALIGLLVGNRTENQRTSRVSWILAAIFGLIFAVSLGGSISSAQLSRENKALTATQERNAERIENLGIEKIDLQNIVEGLKKDKESLQASVNKLEKQVQTFGSNNENLKNQIANLGTSNSDAINAEMERLKTENETLTSSKSELEGTVTELNSQITNLQDEIARITAIDEDPTEPPSNPDIPANFVQTGTTGITYTIVETNNSGGNITIWIRAVNEGAEAEVCFSSGTFIFDTEGIQRKQSYFIINNERDTYSCGQAIIPSGIPVRVGIVFEGLDIDTDIIPQLTSEPLVYRNIPVPYRAED